MLSEPVSMRSSLLANLCVQKQSAIAATKGQDQAIGRAQETIAKAQTYLEMTLKARGSTMKTIVELSRQRDDLNKALLANQEELEALQQCLK